MNNLRFIKLIAFAYLFTSCNDNNNVPDQLNSEYEACCGVNQVEFVQDSYYIYVPNCFSPDGDAINDFFVPSLSDNIDSILSYEIFSDNSDVSTLLFSIKDIEVLNFKSDAWYGRDTKNNEYRGKFIYRMKFKTTNDNEINVFGYACALYCLKDGAVLKDKYGCFFGNQGYHGRLDSLIPIFENCFK